MLRIAVILPIAIGCASQAQPPPQPQPPPQVGSLLFIERNSLTDGWSHGGDVRVLDPDTGVMTTLTTGEDAQGPSWSHSGSHLAFQTIHAMASEGRIHVMRSDGSDEHLVTAGTTREGWPTWSPKRDELVFASGHSLYRIAADGTGLAQLTIDTNDIMPVWSSDGESIVSVSYREGMPYTGQLYVMDREGGGQRRLTTLSVGEQTPRFSPDGQKLTFGTYTYDAASHSILPGATYVGDADGSNLEDVNAWLAEPLTAPSLELYWSPDMTKLAYISIASNELRVVDLATSTHRVIATGLMRGALAWDPTGQFLAFRIGWIEGRNLYIADLETGTVDQITTTGKVDGHFVGLDWASR